MCGAPDFWPSFFNLLRVVPLDLAGRLRNRRAASRTQAQPTSDRAGPAWRRGPARWPQAAQRPPTGATPATAVGHRLAGAFVPTPVRPGRIRGGRRGSCPRARRAPDRCGTWPGRHPAARAHSGGRGRRGGRQGAKNTWARRTPHSAPRSLCKSLHGLLFVVRTPPVGLLGGRFARRPYPPRR